MSQLGIGRRAGRAEALTVVMPLRRGGASFLALWLTYLRVLPSRRLPVPWRFPPTSRADAVGTLDRLRFVSAIRWSLLPPFAPGGGWWVRPADARWHLLFESNFDGDWDEYLDAFGAVMGLPLLSIVGVGHGFPGLDDIDLFKAYTKRHDVTPAHYVSAYEDLSSNDVHQALLRLEGGAARRAARMRGFGRSHPRWTTLLLPLRAGRSSAAVRAAQALGDDLPVGSSGDDSRPLFLRTGRIHFGRAVILHRPAGGWLLMTFTHDGTTRQLIESLVAVDAGVGPGPADPGAAPTTRLRRLLECCVGVPAGSEAVWTDARLVAHLADAVPRSSRWFMAYCGYPGRTVREVRALEDIGTSATWPEPEPR